MKKKTLTVSLAVVSILLAGCVATGAYFGVKKYQDDHPKTSETSDPEDSIKDSVSENGIAIKQVKVSDTEYYFTYTLTNGDNGDAVLVTAGWTDTSYTGVLGDYVTITHTKSAKKVTVVVKKVFTKQFSIKLVSANTSSVNATVKVDYQSKMTSVTPTFAYNLSGNATASYSFAETGGSLALDKNIKAQDYSFFIDLAPVNTYITANYVAMGISNATITNFSFSTDDSKFDDALSVTSGKLQTMDNSNSAFSGLDEYPFKLSAATPIRKLDEICLNQSDGRSYLTLAQFPSTVVSSALNGNGAGISLDYTCKCDGVERHKLITNPLASLATNISAINPSDTTLVF